MKTKLEKEIDWIREQGYIVNTNTCYLIFSYVNGDVGMTSSIDLEDFQEERIRGFCRFLAVGKEGELIPFPEFEDDKVMPVDEYLVKYTSSPECSSSLFNALSETNHRMKVVEASLRELRELQFEARKHQHKILE